MLTRLAYFVLLLLLIYLVILMIDARASTGCHSRSCTERVAQRHWQHVWARLPLADKLWARRTSACESGGRAWLRNPPYSGAFQFMLPTAWAAGFRVAPHLTSWVEQAVRAVRWRNRAGRGQWPVCG